MIDFFKKDCQTDSKKSRFGLCDDPPPANNPAYIDEHNGQNWIATVENHYSEKIDFFAIDNCVTVPPKDHKGLELKNSKRCDGVLVCSDTIAFVELKSRKSKGSEWVETAQQQLLTTIGMYGQYNMEHFSTKRAYIANNERPQARRGQAMRIERFNDQTGGYTLYVKATIDLFSSEG